MKDFAVYYIGGFIGCFVGEMIQHFGIGRPVSVVRLLVLPFIVALLCWPFGRLLKNRLFGGAQ